MTSAQPSFIARRREGSRPATTPTNPHTQLTQNAPTDLQERVFDFAKTLGDVVVGPSSVSVPGARAFHLPSCGGGHGTFMVEHEFAHLHPPRDGSLHAVLSPEIVDRVIDNGWAERHPLAGKHGLPSNIVMLYGPRDEAELEIVIDLVKASWAHAHGL